MKILLEKNWYLTSDENQYILSEEKEQNVKNKETGVMEKKKVMVNKYFMPTMQGVIDEYFKLERRKSSITSFEGVKKKLDKQNKLLEKWNKELGL